MHLGCLQLLHLGFVSVESVVFDDCNVIDTRSIRISCNVQLDLEENDVSERIAICMLCLWPVDSTHRARTQNYGRSLRNPLEEKWLLEGNQVGMYCYSV